jgi:hypothetical protein
MKRFLVLLLLVFPSVAVARVVMTPTIPRSCREAESWEKVTKCLEKFGKPKIERELPTAKLVSITSTSFRVPGLYVYKQVGKKWLITGMFEMSGTFEVFGFSNPKLGKRSTYRFDVGMIEQAGSSTDGSLGVVKQTVSMFCTGDSYFCAQAVTSCDYFVDARARETFRGKLTIKGGKVRVSGDRTRSGNYCLAPEEIQIVFDEPDDL